MSRVYPPDNEQLRQEQAAEGGLSQANEADSFSLDSDAPLKVCRLLDDDEPCESCQ